MLHAVYLRSSVLSFHNGANVDYRLSNLSLGLTSKTKGNAKNN